MSKTVTLRLDERIYNLFLNLAKKDNRSMSNFIETSVLRYLEIDQYVDEFEMDEIRGNQELNESIRSALDDVKNKKGRFVE